MLNFIPDACSLFLHFRVKVSDWSNMSTVTILQIFIFKMTVLWVLIMQSDILDEHGASVFRVTAWFKWLLKCLARECLWITWGSCKVVACYEACPLFPFRSSERPKALYFFCISDAVRGCAMTKAVRRWPLSEEVQVRSAVSSCEIVDKWHWDRFPPVNIVQPMLHIHLPVANAV